MKSKIKTTRCCYDCAEASQFHCDNIIECDLFFQWFNSKEDHDEKSCRHKYETTITPEKYWNISFTESDSG